MHHATVQWVATPICTVLATIATVKMVVNGYKALAFEIYVYYLFAFISGLCVV